MDKRLKVLLVKYHDTNIRPIPDKAERTLQVLPSLGILYLASILRQEGHEVEILDANAENLSLQAFEQRVRDSRAQIVGFTTMTAGWPSTVEGAGIVRRALPEALIVVGGPQLSVHPELCLTFDVFDIGVIGGGEEAMLDIANAVAGGTSWLDIPGTVVRSGGQVAVHPQRQEFRPIDSYPFPAVDLLKRENYRAITVAAPFFTMVTSRGCPFSCRFCSQIYGGKEVTRFRSPQSVVEEISIYANRYSAKEIVFFDETFTLRKDRVLEVCRLLKENHIKVSFDLRTRVDSIDEEMFAALREVGARRVHLGVESGTKQIIERMNKGITLEQARLAVDTAKKYGYETRGYFMIGYLGETPETYRETVRVAKSLNLDWASFSITTPLPATKLYEEARDLGLVAADYWEKYTLLKQERLDFPVLETKYWNEAQLHKMLSCAYRDFYVRPKFVWNRLRSIRGLDDIAELLRGVGVLLNI